MSVHFSTSISEPEKILSTHYPTFRVYIDYVNGIQIEGFASIDHDTNGRYFLSGSCDSSGNISFTGTEWIDNPSGFGFASFVGTVSGNVIQGSVEGDSSRPFTLTKVSDAYESYRVNANTLPRDWKGEYDGYSGSVVVRRNIEFHIEAIDGENVTGTAIISPSEKADSALGANGSYQFRATVDFQKGRITFQGHTWIDYPVGGGGVSNWSFVYLSGSFLENGTRISGTSDNGIWEMEAMQLQSYEVNSGFTLGRDNNSFVHTSSTTWNGAGFAGRTTYQMDEAYFRRLTAQSSKGEKNKIQKSMSDAWGGSCYGIAMSMGLLFEGRTSLDLLSETPSDSYYQLPLPHTDNRLNNSITYYQLSQGLSNWGKEAAAVSSTYNYNFFQKLANWKFSYDSMTVFLQKLVNSMSEGHVLLLGFSTQSGGHAVLMTGIRFVNDHYEVQVYDENCISGPGDTGTFSTMTIDRNLQRFSYTDANGDVIDNNTFVAIYYLDWNALGELPIDELVSAVPEDHMIVSFILGQEVSIENAARETISYQNWELSGDMPVYDVKTIMNDAEIELLIETNASELFSLNQVSEKVDVSVQAENSFVALQGSGIESAQLRPSEGVTANGEAFSYQAYVSTDEIPNGDNGLVKVESTGEGEVNVTKTGTEVAVTSEAAAPVEVTVYQGTDSQTTVVDEPEGEVKVDAAKPITHEWSDWILVKAPTAVEAGVMERTCSIHGEKETREVAKLSPTISVNASYLVMQAGKSTSKVKVTGLAKGDSVKKWKSSNKKVVKVTQKGKIKAIKKGKATVTISLQSGLTYKIKVKVQKGAVKAISMENVPATLTVKKGKTKTLKPVLSPFTATSKITYKSSNKKVATVSAKGKIKGVKKGTCTITVKSGKAKVGVKVTVK